MKYALLNNITAGKDLGLSPQSPPPMASWAQSGNPSMNGEAFAPWEDVNCIEVRIIRATTKAGAYFRNIQKPPSDDIDLIQKE